MYEIINFLTYFIPFSFAIISAVLLVWYIYCCSENVLYGAVLIAFSYILETAFVTAPKISVGMMLSSNDCMIAILISSLMLRVLIYGVNGVNKSIVIWLMMLVLFAYNLSIGLSHYGSKAGVEAREDFYFLIVGLYFMSFEYPEKMIKNISKIGLFMIYAIVFISVYRFIGVELGFVSKGEVHQIGASNEFRVVGSGQALLFSAIGGVFFHLWLTHNKAQLAYCSVIFFLLVIVLQHRSVWVASIFLLIMLAFLNTNAFLARSKKMIPAFVFMAISVLFIFAYYSGAAVFDSLGKSIMSATDTENGTQVDRWETWVLLMSRWANSSIGNYLTGLDYGSGWDRYQRGRFLEFAPHNQYVYVLLRQGVLGLLLFISMVFILVAGLKREIANCNMAIILMSLIVALMIYYIPYQIHYIHAILFGVSTSYLARKKE
jgi:hypothetical protein